MKCKKKPKFSSKDPFNFDADPDPGSALENGSGSGLFP